MSCRGGGLVTNVLAFDANNPMSEYKGAQFFLKLLQK